MLYNEPDDIVREGTAAGARPTTLRAPAAVPAPSLPRHTLRTLPRRRAQLLAPAPKSTTQHCSHRTM